MTIVEYARYFVAPQSIRAHVTVVQPGVKRPSRRRRYNHPRRERFVEDAAMSREMFRL